MGGVHGRDRINKGKGTLAQLGERHVCIVEAADSNSACSMKKTDE